MSIVKVEISVPELRRTLNLFAENRLKALETLVTEFCHVAAMTVNHLLNAEMSIFLGQPDQADNKRNGYKERDYTIKHLGTLRIRLPQDRKNQFQSAVVPKSERMDPRLKEDLAALHLAGISTRTLAMISERILGIEVSNKTVTNALETIAPQAEKWLRRPIDERYWALIIDGTYFKVQRRGTVEREPSLVVIGISENNHKSILAIEPGHRDNVDSWRSVFRDLKDRGLDGGSVKLGVMDGLPGLEKLFCEEFPNAFTARCWFHAMQNALAKTPKRLAESFHQLARRVMYAESRQAALDAFEELKSAMQSDARRAVECLEKDLASLTSHYYFDRRLWRSLKTTNSVERINKEFKRRIKPMETLGEMTLQTVLAFTALRIEMAWRRRAIDTYETDHLDGRKRKNVLESVLDGGEEFIH